MRLRALLTTTIGVLALTATVPVPTALAATPTIVVNTVGDQADLDPSDGVCDSSAAGGAQCTLRAAIQTANHAPDLDTIGFVFGGTSAIKIVVASSLPAITQPLTIDGYSAAGTSVNTAAKGSNAKLRIVLVGSGSGRGLEVAAPSTIKGLVVQRFGTGIFIAPGGEGSAVAGNFIGTTASGMTRAGNVEDAIHVDCFSSIVIGGTTRAKRNLISGNRDGILLCEETDGTVIVGNIIGLGADGNKDLGNDRAGILAYGSQNVRIGGDLANSANVIAYNKTGIALGIDPGVEPHGIQIARNSIFSNDGLGIDLEWDGVTKNDGAGDADTGANGRQNFPVLKSATTRDGVTRIQGQLRSTASSSFTLRFFSSPAGETEGRTFVGKALVTTAADGMATFSVKTAVTVAPGRWVTATATDRTTAETSEFSAAKAATR